MRTLLIGASGTIGGAVAAQLGDRHDLVRASRNGQDEQVDLADPDSIRDLFSRVGELDAVVCAAGRAIFKRFGELEDEDLRFSLDNKLMGQVNLVRYGMESVTDGGSFTLTSGVLAQNPETGTAAISLVNSGVEGFARAAALEAPRRIRVNVVSPPWVRETLEAMGMPPERGLPVQTVAEAYASSVEGGQSGEVLRPRS